MNNSNRLASAAVVLALFLHSSPARSNGFEKANLTSGRFTGIGSAASSSVRGSEAVIFNPAGLARSQGVELTVQGALGLTSGSAPVTSTSPLSMKSGLVPIGGAMVSYGILENLGIGAGVSVSGGAGADFGEVDFGPSFSALKPEFKSLFGLAELSLGAGYEVVEGLRIGAAWRVQIVRAESKAAVLLDPNTLAAVQFADASGTSFGGFRFGAQYSPRDAGWGVGMTVRTPVDFAAKGTSSGSMLVSGAGTTVPITGGEVTLASTLPLQIALGSNQSVTSTVRLFEEYSFTRNTSIQSLSTSGADLTIPGAPAPIPVSTFSSSLHWRNMHQLRLGTEWQAMEDLVLRGGYILSSQVVPSDEATPFFSPPGKRHTFSVGASKQIFSKTRLDGAIEYDTASGTATGSTLPNLDGEYKQRTVAFYLSVAQSF